MSKPLTKYSDKDLRAELARREAERKLKQEQRHQAHSAKVASVLTQELIDLFHPHHDVTSCNDEAPDNTFGSENGTTYPRCVRCGLLDIFRHNRSLPDGIFLTLDFHSRSYPEDEAHDS